MTRGVERALRIVIGFLAAGLIAPFTLWLPDTWQGPPLLVALALVCVTAALLIGRRSPP